AADADGAGDVSVFAHEHGVHAVEEDGGFEGVGGLGHGVRGRSSTGSLQGGEEAATIVASAPNQNRPADSCGEVQANPRSQATLGPFLHFQDIDVRWLGYLTALEFETNILTNYFFGGNT